MFTSQNNKKSCLRPDLASSCLRSGLKQRGFTIIELLVVIAIIGLISSVVLVSLKGSTSKAKISKSLEFSQTILNAIGVDAVGIWSFDEGALGVCAGGDVCDKSGYGNHGTFGGDPQWVDGEENTPHAIMGVGEGRSALEFNGATDYIQIPHSSSLNITDAITIEAWIKPNTLSVRQMFFGRGGNYAEIAGNNRILMSLHCEDGTSPFVGNVSTNLATLGMWHNFVTTFDKNGGNNNLKLYINGELKDTTNAGSSPIDWGSNDLHIGNLGTGYHFNGAIDEVRIYARALNSAEIQQHYAAGAAKHNLALK